ncbi:MAG TPA: Crp/Fnr family transcriptional regulator [Candidatus Saccharimonadales bacterium]
MNKVVSDKIESFFSKYPLKTVNKGHIFIFPQEDPEHIFHLVTGKVKVYDINQHGVEIVVLEYGPPAFFPMSWAINKQPNEFYYGAKTNVSVRQASVKDSLEFLKNNSDVLFDLLSRVYLGTDILLRRMAHIMGGNATTRVLFELAVEGRRQPENEDNTYSLSFGETELAAKAGLTRETVSRIMKDLKTKNLVSVLGKKIIILNLDKLILELDHTV